MNESLPSRVCRAIPWGLLWMLALVGAIERSWFDHNLAIAKGLGHGWSATARQVKKVARGRDVLCFGDSMIKYNLIPNALRERTGRSAYNLGLVGGTAPATYFMLRRALQAGARPSMIVVDFARELLQFEPDSKTSALPWADLLNLRETMELCCAARSLDLFAGITVARLLPSFRNRDGVRAFVQARLRGENPNWDRGVLQIRRNCNLNLGAMVNVKALFEDFPAPTGVHTQTPTWRPHPTNLHFFHLFLELATKRGIEVVWLLPPVSPGTQRIWDASGEERLFESFARSVLRQYSPLRVVDARYSGYEASVFHDATHLDRDGAMALSGSVADHLRRDDVDSATTSGWITLPAYRSPSSAVPVEDLGQSGIAVLQKLKMRDNARQ